MKDMATHFPRPSLLVTAVKSVLECFYYPTGKNMVDFILKTMRDLYRNLSFALKGSLQDLVQIVTSYTSSNQRAVLTTVAEGPIVLPFGSVNICRSITVGSDSSLSPCPVTIVLCCGRIA